MAGGRSIRDSPLAYGRHRIAQDDIDAVTAAMHSGYLTGGPRAADFEDALAERCGTKHAVVVANGTSALIVALAALEIEPGAPVVTTPLTFVATANAILLNGGRPVFADIGADLCIDPVGAENHIRQGAAAVIGVDYGGLPCDVHGLKRAAAGRPVIVDAAHSLGATIDGRPVGADATVTTLSFHPVKAITSGEGGACVTDDADLAERMRRLRNHGMTSSASQREGRTWQYDVTELSSNHRMSDIQAALGRSQLRRLDASIRRRGELAERYRDLLASVDGISTIPDVPGRQSAWHIFLVRVDRDAFGWSRDEVIDALRAENIMATLHYPLVTDLALYRKLGYESESMPVARAVNQQLVTLPLFPQMTESDQDDVVAALTRLYRWRH